MISITRAYELLIPTWDEEMRLLFSEECGVGLLDNLLAGSVCSEADELKLRLFFVDYIHQYGSFEMVCEEKDYHFCYYSTMEGYQHESLNLFYIWSDGNEISFHQDYSEIEEKFESTWSDVDDEE